jgi:hypothetical protein
MQSRALACVIVAALSLGAFAAYADRFADAEALFKAAKQLEKDGKLAEACPKYEASYKLDEQLGTLMNLANCYELLGKVATAWARWNAAYDWAKREGDDRVPYIEERQRKLDPRLPKLVIKVVNPVPDLHVRRGDSDLDDASWGVPTPVDPGFVAVSVLRGEVVLEERKVDANEGKVAELTLDLAAIAAAHPAPQPTSTAVPVPTAVPTSTTHEPYDPTQRTAGYVVGAVGLAATLIAGGLEIGALVKKGEAEEPDACVNKICAPGGIDAADSAATLAEAGQWLGIAGLAVLAIGVTVVLTAPSDDSDTSARIVVRPGGLAVEGSF